MTAIRRHETAAPQRLAEIDSLRGIAALSVALFHYTSRYVVEFHPLGAPSFVFAYGNYGVSLFFIISGFVIFMTLERTRSGIDFVVSRFSRLFPAYWAAIALSFGATRTFGLPGFEVSVAQALGNALMFHGLLGVPHVDGVYWSLEVELLFYIGMLALWAKAGLNRVHWMLWALLALRLVWQTVDRGFEGPLPWTLSRLLILRYLPWFALGISIYQLTLGAGRGDARSAWLTVVAALACFVFAGYFRVTFFAVGLFALVWAAAAGRARWLRNPVLGFLGTISYPLYLLHENIGWIVQREVLAHGGSFDLGVVAALATSIGLASLVTFAFEQPCMRAIRNWYRQRSLRLAS